MLLVKIIVQRSPNRYPNLLLRDPQVFTTLCTTEEDLQSHWSGFPSIASNLLNNHFCQYIQNVVGFFSLLLHRKVFFQNPYTLRFLTSPSVFSSKLLSQSVNICLLFFHHCLLAWIEVILHFCTEQVGLIGCRCQGLSGGKAEEVPAACRWFQPPP